MKYKLICFDMDGVIFKDINFWMELHKKLGTLEQGKELTKKYLNTDYNTLVEEVVVKLWKGKSAKAYYDLVKSLEFLPGVKETFDYIKKKGYLTAIVSASSMDVAKRAQNELGVDYVFANELVIKDNKISGEFKWPIGAGNEYKAQVIRDLCSKLEILKEEVIYIGDSNTDIPAFKEVGLSIAFNSNSKELKEVADYVVDSNNLFDVVKYIS